MGVSVRIEYDRKVDVSAVIDAAVTEGLGDVVEHCLEDANRTIPIEEGTLEGTGFTQVDGLTGQVGYGTPYARYQHEDDSLRHDAGRRSHWLEATVYENEQTYQEFIAAKVRDRLGG